MLHGLVKILQKCKQVCDEHERVLLTLRSKVVAEIVEVSENEVFVILLKSKTGIGFL